MVLQLSAEHQSQIRRHGETAYPRECCGVLLGTLQQASPEDAIAGTSGTVTATAIATVMEVHAVENVWIAASNDQFDVVDGAQETAERRFTIAPQDLLRLQKAGRDRGFDIIGIYHSHPNYPATPSDFDRTYAWAQYSYPIVAVHRGKAVDLRSWRLDDSGQFQPEAIHSSPAAPPQGTPSISNGSPTDPTE